MNVIGIEQSWITRANALIAGRRVVEVIYAHRDQTRALGWAHRPPLLRLDTGLALYAASDPEGADAGALMTTCARLPVLPPLRLEEFIPRPRRDQRG